MASTRTIDLAPTCASRGERAQRDLISVLHLCAYFYYDYCYFCHSVRSNSNCVRRFAPLRSTSHAQMVPLRAAAAAARRAKCIVRAASKSSITCKSLISHIAKSLSLSLYLFAPPLALSAPQHAHKRAHTGRAPCDCRKRPQTCDVPERRRPSQQCSRLNKP